MPDYIYLSLNSLYKFRTPHVQKGTDNRQKTPVTFAYMGFFYA